MVQYWNPCDQWSNIETGIPQGSILGPLLFLVYINNLSDGLTTNTRLFADYVSLSFVVDKINLSATNLNSDFSKINAWANQWKMTFNPHPNTQAQEVIFLVKQKRHPLNFTNNTVQQLQFQKHLYIYLDGKLDFRKHAYRNKQKKSVYYANYKITYLKFI